MNLKIKSVITFVFVFAIQFCFSQKTITGKVSDNTGPIPGVNITVKGTTNKTSTDFDGTYTIKAKEGDVLVFSFIGMRQVTRTVDAQNVYNMKMSEDSKELAEVVVQGYRTVSKKSAVTANAGVTSRTLENRPNANVINALQGQLAGVNIATGTGQPGSKSTVIIRGLGTVNGNTDPLYVIDGFPSNSDNFRSINSNDIESLDVLKDAAAISEYGSRGSNGVIVIKTRNGKFGEPKTTFNYSTVFGTNELQRPSYSYANSKELLRLEKIKGVGRGASLTDAQIDSYAVNTDWVNYFFRKGTSVTHNLSVTNNGKNLNSFTSASYFNQEGILKTTGLQRFTVRNNIIGKSENNKFKFSVNTAFGHSKNNEATNLGGGAINRNYVLGAFISAPYISPDEYQNSAQLFALYGASGSSLLYTPLFLIDKLNQYQNLTEETRIDVTTELSYKLTKDLTARVRTSGELLSTRFHQAEFPGSFNALLFLQAGQVFGGFEDINQRREFLFNNLWQLDYNKSIGKHAFGVNISAEYNDSRLNTNNFRQRGLDPKTFVPNTGAGYVADTAANDFYVPLISASQLRNQIISYFGSLDYDFNKKYGIVGTYRVDSSSRFIAQRQTGSFWSVGARWNLDEEAFMKSLDFVDVLKIRGSIGTVGNSRIVDGSIYIGINPPAFTDIYSGTNNAYNNGTGYGFTPGYKDLRWETTEQYNIGLDFELYKSRIRGSFDYYNKKTIDLFLSQPVVPAVGSLTNIINQNTDATVTNKGYELNLAIDVLKNENFRLTLRGNGSYNKNVVDGIKANNGRILVTPVAGGATYITQNGGSINEPFVYAYLGVNPTNGKLLFEDINGNPTENPIGTDRKASGKNYIPQYQGGFGFDGEYKGFFVSSSFTFAQKVWRIDGDLANLYDPSNINTFTVTGELLNSWTPSNPNSNLPSLTASNAGAGSDSDRFLRDASYIRLRNFQIGYRVPRKYLDRTFFKDLSFTLQGENLFTFTKWQGFDVESNRFNNDVYQYPTPKIYTFGIDLKF